MPGRIRYTIIFLFATLPVTITMGNDSGSPRGDASNYGDQVRPVSRGDRGASHGDRVQAAPYRGPDQCDCRPDSETDSQIRRSEFAEQDVSAQHSDSADGAMTYGDGTLPVGAGVVRQPQETRTTAGEAPPPPELFRDPDARDVRSSSDPVRMDSSAANAAVLAAKYAMVNIRNNTSQVVAFEFRWGNGTWQTRSVDPRSARCFWWEYPAGSNVSASFYVRRGSITWALRRVGTMTNDACDLAAQYEFRGSGIFALSGGEVFPGDWTRVAWFRYGNWSNGMYVNGIAVDRMMGSLGYDWSYKVTVVGTALSSGLPCVPGQHWEGSVRAKVTGPDGGFLDTGDMAVHSGGGNKEQVWANANPGRITACELWRNTWCEW